MVVIVLLPLRNTPSGRKTKKARIPSIVLPDKKRKPWSPKG